MNDDQAYDAAEREMDLYRAEIDRITAARDEAREQVRLAREDRDQLRTAVLDLAAEYGDASEHDDINGYTPGSLYMAIRAELLNAAAVRLRAIAGPPS